MSDQLELPLSLADQIASSTLKVLAASNQFGENSLARLRELAANGTLKRAQRVMEAIKLTDPAAEAILHEAP